MPGGQVPVFYINVAARTDRREFMERQFAKLGVVGERIDAVLPADVPADVAASARRADGTWRVGLGEIACTMSHFAAWRRAISGGAAACAVLEDDGLISGDFPRFLQELGTSLPQGVDVLKLETFRQPVRLGRHAITAGGSTARRLTSTHYGGCGYIISTGLAQHLMANTTLVSGTIDGHLFARTGDVLGTRRVYQLLSAQVVQVMHQQVDGAGISRSDLQRWRDETQVNGSRASRWHRLRTNVALALREFRYFGSDVFNSREPIPFADD